MNIQTRVTIDIPAMAASPKLPAATFNKIVDPDASPDERGRGSSVDNL